MYLLLLNKRYYPVNLDIIFLKFTKRPLFFENKSLDTIRTIICYIVMRIICVKFKLISLNVIYPLSYIFINVLLLFLLILQD